MRLIIFKKSHFECFIFTERAITFFLIGAHLPKICTPTTCIYNEINKVKEADFLYTDLRGFASSMKVSIMLRGVCFFHESFHMWYWIRECVATWMSVEGGGGSTGSFFHRTNPFSPMSDGCWRVLYLLVSCFVIWLIKILYSQSAKPHPNFQKMCKIFFF